MLLFNFDQKGLTKGQFLRELRQICAISCNFCNCCRAIEEDLQMIPNYYSHSHTSKLTPFCIVTYTRQGWCIVGLFDTLAFLWNSKPKYIWLKRSFHIFDTFREYDRRTTQILLLVDSESSLLRIFSWRIRLRDKGTRHVRKLKCFILTWEGGQTH